MRTGEPMTEEAKKKKAQTTMLKQKNYIIGILVTFNHIKILTFQIGFLKNQIKTIC